MCTCHMRADSFMYEAVFSTLVWRSQDTYPENGVNLSTLVIHPTNISWICCALQVHNFACATNLHFVHDTISYITDQFPWSFPPVSMLHTSSHSHTHSCSFPSVNVTVDQCSSTWALLPTSGR